MSYEWTPSERPANGLIPEDECPTRLAATIALLVPSRSTGQLLLVNPHPDSWNNWQFPYASIASDVPDGTDVESFEQLETALRAVTDLSSHDALRQAESAVAGQLGTGVSVTGGPATETFALRFSKTASVWTGYRFAYLVGAVSDVTAVEHATHWLDVPQEPTGVAPEVEGLPLSDNVAAVLFENGRNLGEIRTAIESAA